MASRITAFLALAPLTASLLLASSCSDDPPTGPKLVCLDSFTKACIPCPGATVCVDPQRCVVIPCGSGDVSFQGQDAQKPDAGAAGLSDGALLNDAEPPADAEPSADAEPQADGAIADAMETTSDAGEGDGGTTPTDTAVVGCAAGAKRCTDDKTPAFCFDDKWMDLAPCKNGFTCDKGACVCANECLAINQMQCLDKIAAFKSCQLMDGCLTWSVPLSCKPGEICKNGACKEPVPGSCNPTCPAGQACQNGTCVLTGCAPACGKDQHCEKNKCVPNQVGTLTCGQIYACVSQFSNGPNDKVNIDACVAKGSSEAQKQYLARKACIALSCQTYIDQGKYFDAMLCVYTFCSVEQTSCLGSGSDDCQKFAGCFVSCGNSALCMMSCHAAASTSGAKNFYALQACGENQCPGLVGNAWTQCANQKCKAHLDKCSGGSLSCAQILKCASGCQTKACAQACKDKGSVQGLANLQKLLDCNNGKCGNYCTNGSPAQCNACMASMCGAEQAACQ